MVSFLILWPSPVIELSAKPRRVGRHQDTHAVDALLAVAISEKPLRISRVIRPHVTANVRLANRAGQDLH
jgi:hypothetical protein